MKKIKDKIMVTPCNHKFHIPCLVEWMSIKMECNIFFYKFKNKNKF